MIQEAIDAFKAQRLSDMEYLEQVMEIRNKVITKKHDDRPLELEGNEVKLPDLSGIGNSHINFFLVDTDYFLVYN